MAIHIEETAQISGGFSKEIDEGAKSLVFDILQQHQYQFPIKSTIREIVSNGVDSIAEKNAVLQILSGEAQVSDFYVEELAGDIYKASKFKPEYYNAEFLSKENNVIVTYTDGGTVGKDTITIEDFGVGLGDYRLEGYFNLGFSTKRTSKLALGKFGIGAKSPLSVGVPFYSIRTRHNGKEFQFNIYSSKVESLVPEKELLMEGATLTEVFNHPHVFGNGYKCYYRNTTKNNGVLVEIACKKHHKESYIDAVTKQLLYFTNVKLFVQSGDTRTEIPVKADILYEDDLIVLSKNSDYKKPHLLLNKVNYGYINFLELELEEKLGNIGIKINSEEVSINPSRESFIWDDKTRAAVQNSFAKVVDIAENAINKQLSEKDFFKWLSIASSLASKDRWWHNDENDLVSRLAGVIDMTQVQLTYDGHHKLKLNWRLFEGLKARYVSLTTKREGSKLIKKVEYTTNEVYQSIVFRKLPILLQVDNTSNRKTKYILQHVHQSGFVSIRLSAEYVPGQPITPEMVSDEQIWDEIDMRSANSATSRQSPKEIFIELKVKVVTLLNLMVSSTEARWYEEIEVPDWFTGNNDDTDVEEDVEEGEEKKVAVLSAAERRKLHGSTTLSTLRANSCGVSRFNKAYELQRFEVPIREIDKWANNEVYWSNQDTEPMLHTIAMMTRRTFGIGWSTGTLFEGVKLKTQDQIDNEINLLKAKNYTVPYASDYIRCNNFHDDSEVRLIRVAQDNVKYYQDFKHVTKFFRELKGKTITMSSTLQRWNTARMLKQHIVKLEFLNGFAVLSPQKHAQYKKLELYVNTHYKHIVAGKIIGTEHINDLTKYLDSVSQFQLYVHQNPEDVAGIAQLAQEVFNPAAGVEINNACAFDNDLYQECQELVSWANSVYTMLNMIPILTDAESLSEAQEQEIVNYMKYRNCEL